MTGTDHTSLIIYTAGHSSHRRLLSDYLQALGIEIRHILRPGIWRPHEMTPGATIVEGPEVIYPAAA